MVLNLIVGLGNPGSQYALTRHNVGMWFIDALAQRYDAKWRQENKFFGQIAQIQIDHHQYWLLKPSVFMNQSGQSVVALVNFHKFNPESILVAHDELSFPAGCVRFKEGGGHAGHNGLRNIISHLHSSDFKRLRIGINHPGDKHQVANYVLSKPNRDDELHIEQAIESAIEVIPNLVTGDFQSAFRYLHND